MTKVIDFNSHPLSQKLKEKDQEIENLKKENIELRSRVSTMISVNEMLKLQINEAITTLAQFHTKIQSSVSILTGMKSQLPTIETPKEGK